MIAPEELTRIKAFPIVEFLASLGRYPVRRSPKEYCYFSPFRNEGTPSFYVNIEKNLFNDFGESGGDIIQLVMKLEKISFQAAVERLCSWCPGEVAAFGVGPTATPGSKPGIEITSVGPISHPALIQYIENRGIPFFLAADYLKEVHYLNNGKHFFSIGFQNDLGGFELRNKTFQGSISPKGISTYLVPSSKAVSLFEGFFDFLSALVYFGVSRPRQSCIILNSVSNLNSAFDSLSGYQKVFSYLDTDKAGKEACEKLSKNGFPVIDQSSIYQGHNDLNDYLRSNNR